MDRSTVDRLIVEHLPVALRFARRLAGDPDHAEDVVQDALCQVLRHWRSYRGEASFRTWLLRIVVNADRDRRRKHRDVLPMTEREVMSRDDQPDAGAAANELHAKIRAAITELPDRQREIALLCLGEGLSAKEVAEVQSADMTSPYVEPVLLRQLRLADDQRRLAILQLLSLCGTPQSTAALLQLSRREAFREEALQTLEMVVGKEGLATAARQSADAGVRNAIYRRLWEDADAVDTCLAMVQNDALRDEVLEALDEVTPPLLNALLARLDAEEPHTRLAAALVLGHANGPVVAESLIGIVSQNPACNSETWIALMACRGPHIDQFLDFAIGQPRLLGSLNRARVYWARITY
jgi:RNA polymerase sigma-70 factor (ECF subfamily)